MMYLAIDIVDELEVEILYMGTELGRERFLFERGRSDRNDTLKRFGLKPDAPMSGTFTDAFFAHLDSRGIVHGWGARGLFLTSRELDK